MGTETKLNCNTTNGGGTPKLMSKTSFLKNGSSGTNGLNRHTHENCINGKDTLNGAAKQDEPVRFVPIHIEENNVIEGAKEILKVIRPHWDIEAVKFKKFTDGITNKLVGCFYKSPISRSSSNGSYTNGSTHAIHDDNDDSGNLSDTDTDDSETQSTANQVVLVRVYGNKTDLLIDRKAETRNIMLLHTYGFAPSLYAIFKNGLAYDYVPGVTLNKDNVLRPEVWHLVARRMADMHRKVNANGKGGSTDDIKVPMLWKKTQSFFDLVPERFSDEHKHKRLEGTFLPIKRMRDEFAALYNRLEALGSPLVFAHNDLLLGNVVYTEDQQTVSFIDYEYADYNFQAFDIGNHFAEFAGVEDVDYSRYPKREFQLEWLRVYLQTYRGRAQISPAELERLYVQVNQFALAAHFFWTIWSLIQAEHSTIAFDYVEYAYLRYNEYLARKDEFLALGIPSANGSS